MEPSASQQPDSTTQAQTQPEAPASTSSSTAPTTTPAQAQPTQEKPPGGEVSTGAPERPEGIGAQEKAEAEAEAEIGGALNRVGAVLKKPSVGATITGGLILGAASMFGVVEAAVAAGAAYAAYRLLRRKQTKQTA